MMKRLFVAGILATLAVVETLFANAVPGGFSKVPTTDRELVAAASFAVKAQGELMQKKKDSPPTKLKLIKVISAQQQVVAGMNYRMKLEVDLNGGNYEADVVVWWQAWRKPDPYRLTSWKWKFDKRVESLPPVVPGKERVTTTTVVPGHKVDPDSNGIRNVASLPLKKHSFKGWELYVWEEDGDAFYSLMIGSNRLKSADEIAKSAVRGFEAIKARLDGLNKGESVFIHGRRLGKAASSSAVKPVHNYFKKKKADEKSRLIPPTPQPKESPKFNLEYRKTGPHGLPNRIHPIFGKSKTILEIRSGFGIGSGKVRLNRGEWPATLVVRLYLKGLEGLTLSSETQSYKREDLKVLLFDLEGKPIKKGGYLLEKKGYYEVVVPCDLLGPRFNELKINWVDFYRR